jgi:type IV pilus assembly protein PilP
MLQAQPTIDTFDAATLTTLARQQGLQFSQLGLDKPVQSPAMNALQLQQVTQRLEVQGSWAAWMNWLAQWPVSAPGVTLSSLELKADPRGGISAQLAAVALQPTVPQPLFELAGVDLDGTTSPDPFNAQAWTQTQRHHAQQHPSYAVLVEPELMRSHEPLENFPRERLQYVGQISARSDVEALIKVLPAAGAKKEPSMMTVHRVRVGSHVGQDFGRVLAIATDHVDVRELALEPTGEWRTRDVRLPLHEASP